LAQKAKHRQRKTLGPEPSCCWQDRAGGAFGPGLAEGLDSAGPYPDALDGNASSSRDFPLATFANSHCRPGGKPNRRQPCVDGIPAASAAGILSLRKRSVPDENGKPGKNNCKAGMTAEAFLQGGDIRSNSKNGGLI
jgi:hypothetical protein